MQSGGGGEREVGKIDEKMKSKNYDFDFPNDKQNNSIREGGNRVFCVHSNFTFYSIIILI